MVVPSSCCFVYLLVCLFFFSVRQVSGLPTPSWLFSVEALPQITAYTRAGLHGVGVGKGSRYSLASSQVVGFAQGRQSSVSRPFCENTFPFRKDPSFTPSQMLLWPLRAPPSSACHGTQELYFWSFLNIAHAFTSQTCKPGEGKVPGCTWVS